MVTASLKNIAQNSKCPDMSNCNSEFCVKRHPKPCKFFERNNKCRFAHCAYSLENHKQHPEVEHLKNKVAELKCKLEELKKTNIEMSKTLSDVVLKVKDSENGTKYDNETVVNADNKNSKKTETMKKISLKKETMLKVKI